MIIKTSYDIKGNEYDLTEAVSMIQKGKWNDSIEKISKICNIKLEDAKEIGIKIKNELALLSERRSELFKELLVTSGYTFEGYTITKYIDVIGSEAAIGSGFLAELEGSLSDVVGAESTAFSNKIQTARKTAKLMLLQEAFEIGANAVIGLDYQYFALRSNMICVCAKGTAIYVEKS